MVAATRVFDAAAEALRQPGSPGPRDDRELVRLATLAPSSHNTQPWRFHLADDAITIRPDRSRRCPVVDPDDAHLYRSLGCAAENLVHAASLQKLAAEVRYDAETDGVVVELREQDDLAPSTLSHALTTRQCTRTAYDGTGVDIPTLATLTLAGSAGSARTLLVTDELRAEAIAALVERGDLAQLTDAAFRRELVAWIRFGPRSALRTGDGLAGRTSRQPSLPTRLGQLLAPVLISAGAQARKDRELLRSSAGIAIVVTPGDDRVDWVAAGRAVERFALQADLLGLRTAFLNQPIEQPALRDELRTLLREPGYPQLLVRFGHGRRAPYGLRRPVEDVIAS
jgi:hypothetical protein